MGLASSLYRWNNTEITRIPLHPNSYKAQCYIRYIYIEKQQTVPEWNIWWQVLLLMNLRTLFKYWNIYNCSSLTNGESYIFSSFIKVHLGVGGTSWLSWYQTMSGRPPPAASMAVGQFFYPEDGWRELSPRVLLRSSYVHEVSTWADGGSLCMVCITSIANVANSLWCWVYAGDLFEGGPPTGFESIILCELRSFTYHFVTKGRRLWNKEF